MDRKHNREDVLDVLKRYIQKLVDSDYDTSTREEILKAGFRKYYRDVARAHGEGRLLQRLQKEMD